jgi:HEAT repeat protein
MIPPGRFGVLTTDADLVILSVDEWFSAAISLPPEAAKGRTLAELFPSLEARGLLDRLRQTVETGLVQVLSPALNGSVFPCPPLTPSPHFQTMQQHVTVGPLLDGEQIAGLIITVEDVTPALDRARELSDALAGDDDARRLAAAAAIENAPATRHEAVSAELYSDDWRVRRAAVERLASAADAGLLQAVLQLLQRDHRSFSTLSSALKLMAITDVDITAPLADLLRNEDVDLRIQAALALGEQHQPAAVTPLLGALDDPDMNVRFHAIEALGRLRAEAAADRLAAIAESRDFFLGFAALEALALIGDVRTAPRLVGLFAVDEIRDAAARALSRVGDERVIVPLVHVLNTSSTAAAAVVCTVASIGDRLEREGLDISSTLREAISPEGRGHLLHVLDNTEESTRSALARVLGWTGGVEVVRALRTLLQEPSVRDDAIAALVRVGEPAVDVLVEALSSDDDELRTAVVGALGATGSRRATKPLIELLADPSMAIGASGALAKIGDTSAFEPLLALVSHPDTAVRLAAIGALNSIGHADMAGRVLAMIEHPDPLVRESAVRIAGYFGYPAAVDAVLARAVDDEERVRIAALEHLPFLDDARTLGLLDAALAHDTPKARAAAARALARMDAEEALPLLTRALGDADLWVRYYAARSLGQHKDTTAVPELVALAERDHAQPVRVAAIEALGARRATAALESVLRCAGESNVDIATAALFTLGHLGGTEATAALRAAARDADPSRRRAAIHGLAVMASQDAVSTLEWLAAADDDFPVSEAAIDALLEIANKGQDSAPLAVDSLIALLADADRCLAATAAIARIPLSLVGRLARGLNHAHPNVRRRTVDALARYRRSEATRLLEPALEDADPRVREAAALAVGRLGTRMFDRLLGRLAENDPTKSVRRACAEALAAVRRPN